MMIALAAMATDLVNVIRVMVEVLTLMVMNVLAAMVEVKRTAFFAVEEERQNVHLAAAEAQENARYVTVEDIGRVMIVTETAK